MTLINICELCKNKIALYVVKGLNVCQFCAEEIEKPN